MKEMVVLSGRSGSVSRKPLTFQIIRKMTRESLREIETEIELPVLD